MDITQHDNTFTFRKSCQSPGKHHSSHGHIDLCFTCIPMHSKNIANGHANGEITNKSGKFLLPECTSHEKNRCEMYCRECGEPVCAQCATSAHQAHDVTEIETVLEDLKERISAEVRELEETVAPKFRRFGAGFHSIDFDAIITVIHEQEEKLCKVVRDICNQLRHKVAQQRRESKRKHRENQLLASKTEKELHDFIHNSKTILKSNDASAIINYRGRHEQFKGGPKPTCPQFMPGIINKDQISEMVGSLLRSTEPPQSSSQLKLLDNPEVLTTLQSPYASHLHRVLCGNAESDTIWACGNDSKLYQMDGDGCVLKTISAASHVCAMTLNERQELVFSVHWPDTNIYVYDGYTAQTLIDLHPWCPRGLCHSKNGDLLVSMRTLDESQSRVVRYSGTMETQVIQNDPHGKPLFSVEDTAVLLLAENGNGDVCVADHAAETVVVVAASGELRFEYRAYLSPRYKHEVFYPSKISTDVNCQILVNDSANDIVHVIGSDGDFIRYIEYPCNGGLSVDTDHNLVVGDELTGIIRIIKYLQ